MTTGMKQNTLKKRIFTALVTVMLTGMPNFVLADEISDKQDALKKKLDAITKQLQDTSVQIKKTQTQAATLKNEISLYDNHIKTTELQIQAKETSIEDSNLQIKGLNSQIQRKIVELENNRELLATLIDELSKHDDNAFLQLGFGQADLSSFLDEAQFNQNIQSKITSVVNTIKEVKAKMEIQKKELEIQKARLEQLKSDLEDNKSALVTQRKQKDHLLIQTKGVERNYQNLYNQGKKEESDILKEIQNLEDQVRARLGNKVLKPGKVLGWPMDGVLTQGYGNTGFRSLGYSFHNGIDLAAPAGTPIYAAADGTVTHTGSGEAAYGNWVTIKHTIKTKDGNRQIITLYAHMRSIKTSAGATVKRGDLIGYEGNTGNTTRLLYGNERGYHLHFTIFDVEGFGIADGANTKKYGPYKVPYGYTYNPKDFL